MTYNIIDSQHMSPTPVHPVLTTSTAFLLLQSRPESDSGGGRRARGKDQTLALLPLRLRLLGGGRRSGRGLGLE